MRKLTLVALFLSFTVAVFCQGTIKGKLTASSGQNPLPLATFTVFKPAGTTLITDRLSNPECELLVPGLPPNTACRKEFTLTGEEERSRGAAAIKRRRRLNGLIHLHYNSHPFIKTTTGLRRMINNDVFIKPNATASA